MSISNIKKGGGNSSDFAWSVALLIKNKSGSRFLLTSDCSLPKAGPFVYGTTPTDAAILCGSVFFGFLLKPSLLQVAHYIYGEATYVYINNDTTPEIETAFRSNRSDNFRIATQRSLSADFHPGYRAALSKGSVGEPPKLALVK